MQPFPIEELVDRVGSRFSVVVAAAKRAKQIKEGALPLVNLPTRNPLTIALHEIAAGLVQINEEVIIQDERGPIDDGIGELAAPEVVESLIGKADLADDDIAEDAEDDYDADLDEEVTAVLDEELEEEDEEEEEEAEDLELDEDEEEWEEEEATEE
ncbi:MAG: DNA-directed RNA polymerase subunit omega [Armatimonadia bacterium]